MTNSLRPALLTLLLIAIGINILSAQPQDWVVDILDNPAPGYFKMDLLTDYGFFLMDNYGEPKYSNSDNSVSLNNFYKLLPNGNWVCHFDNKFLILNQDLELLDTLIPPSNVEYYDFHDIEMLPNGNFLVIVYKSYQVDMSEIVEGGLEDATLKTSNLLEVDKSGNVFWSWDAIDHYEILDVTEDIELTQNIIDFNHINSIEFDRDGNILISNRHFDEVTKINRSTGDIMWRLGGSKCVNNEFTIINDNIDGFFGFSHQHDLTILPNGNLLLFDNGNLRNVTFSRVVEYQLNQAGKTATKVWEYRSSPDIYAYSMGGVQRLPNGNTLINWSLDEIVEVKPDKSIAFKLRLIGNQQQRVYRAFKHILNMNTVTKSISGNGNYSFNETNNNTDISINVTYKYGSGKATIEKHYYEPPSYSFDNSELDVLLPYRWVLSRDGISTLSGRINIDISRLQNIDGYSKFTIYRRENETIGNFVKLKSSYDPVNKIVSADFIDFGEFVIKPDTLLAPELNYPNNGRIGESINSPFKWIKMPEASKYNLQLSRNAAFQQNELDSIIVSDTLLYYNKLAKNTQYYWRVRAMNNIDTSDWSETYNFTTELNIPQMYYPNDGYSGFQINESLIWLPVQGAQFYTLHVSKNENFSDSVYFNIQHLTSLMLDKILDYNTKYYWRVNAFRNTDTSRWSNTSSFITEIVAPEVILPTMDAINISINGELKWKKVEGAENYSIQISDSPDFINQILEAYNISIESYSYSDLDYDQKYFWRVKAVRSTDSSEWSLPVKFTTLLPTPILVLPEDNAVDIMSGETLSWNPVEGAKLYRLQISHDINFDITISDLTNISVANYKTEILPSQKNLYWRVRASSDLKLSDWSQKWKFTTAYIEPTAKPELISPENNSTQNALEGSFRWSNVINAIKYTIEVSLGPEFNSDIITRTSLTETKLSYSDFSIGTNYYWRVKAYSLFDSSEWSDTWTMRTIGNMKSVKLIYPGQDALSIPINGKFEWEAAEEAISYIIQCSKNKDFSDPLIDKDEISETYYEYKDFENFTIYFWRVKYITFSDTSDWSDTHAFHTKGEYSLDVPILISPPNKESSVPINGELVWENVTGATFYKLGLSEVENFSLSTIKNSMIESNTLQYDNFDFNTTYYWRVAAMNDSSNSNWSEIYEFLSELEPPFILSPLNNSTDNPTTGIIEWKEVTGASRYHLQLSNDLAFNNIIIDKENIPDNNFIYNLSVNTTYYCRVKALSDVNTSRWSEKYLFITDNIMKINEKINTKGISVIPNPIESKAVLSLNLKNSSDVQISITGITGIQVKKHKYSALNPGINSVELDVSGLSNGVYILKVQSNDGLNITKFVVNK